MSKTDIYAEITNSIIAAIESGAGEPVMPWHQGDRAIYMPENIGSGKSYNGINVLVLWAIAEQHGFSEGIWGTYRQWKDKGAQVKKGEKASPIIFYKQLDIDNGDGEDKEKRWYGRASRVFNIAQVEGYEKAAHIPTELFDPIARAENLVLATGAKITEEGTRAFYRSSTDEIFLPSRDKFTGTKTITAAEAFYATEFHEISHWSGSKKRLDRDFSGKFGDDAYAKEELIAEISAAFLCAKLGITSEPRADHAQYIGHWLKIMKGDKKAIFTAASAASKASNFILAFEEDNQQRQAA